MLGKLAQILFAVAICTTTGKCIAQAPSIMQTLEVLQQRVDSQAKQIDKLTRERDEASTHRPVYGANKGNDFLPLNNVQQVPLATEVLRSETGSASGNSTESHHNLNFFADYDNGFSIRPFDEGKHPFQLDVAGWIQFRHHAFDRDVTSWVDNAGVSRPVRSRNAFDVERGRLVFSGYAVDKRLRYFLQLDGDTDGADGVDFFDYWWAWQLTDSFQLQMGKRKVPGSRQWLLGARRTRFIDRPMANDFFRPDRTVGIFGVGTLGEHGHYELMIGNGFRNSNMPNALSDDRFTYAATNYFDPWGSFGGQIVDFDATCTPLARIGHSLAYSPQDSDALGTPLGEADFIRLSDGTRLTQIGALAGGATVSSYDLFFYGVDAAFKFRGWSLNSEVFLRWIENIRGDLPLPLGQLTQYGWYAEGGYFLIPKKLDVNWRCSQVTGEFGTGTEYAAGFNWYPLSKPEIKVSFDVSSLDSSPLQNTTSDILAGDDGTLFRSQFQAEF